MVDEKLTNEFIEKVKKMSIFEKMLNIENEVNTVIKDKVVGGQYKAAQESTILATVKYQEVRFRVYSYPYVREIISEAVKGADRKENFIRVKTTYRFVNVDKPEEFIDMVSYGDGVDTNDKAPGKAVTYADKYALIKAYKLISGDDPDQWASYDGEETANEPVPPSAPQETKAPKEYSQKTLHLIDILDVDPSRVASAMRKDISELTEGDLQSAVTQKLNWFVKKCSEFEIDVAKLAASLGKDVSEITATEYQDAIAKKKAYIESRHELEAKKEFADTVAREMGDGVAE